MNRAHRLRRAIAIATALGAALGGACLAIDGWAAGAASPPPTRPAQAGTLLPADR